MQVPRNSLWNTPRLVGVSVVLVGFSNGVFDQYQKYFLSFLSTETSNRNQNQMDFDDLDSGEGAERMPENIDKWIKGEKYNKVAFTN